MRREQVAAIYNVVMYLGDNLRDFSEAEFVAKKPPAGAGVEWYIEKFDDANPQWTTRPNIGGRDWFVLPIPFMASGTNWSGLTRWR